MSCSTVPALAPIAPTMLPPIRTGRTPKITILPPFALLDSEQRLARLRRLCELGSGLVEQPGCHRLADGQIDASDQGAALSHERKEVAPCIDHRDVVRNSDARS